ncbi:DNA topoisomerase 1 [Pyrus x bretschneideri]|uniref:DNA topoisomerase 1 n=1 Tax=Pyrus x bretschneideri TaxID=225117 RepID=UPI002030C3FB|nr:DNA topoisomerase 1 [Pyrus x bretschneideri]
MAMIHSKRLSTASSFIFSNTFAASALCLRRSMAKLQWRAFEAYPCACLPSSSNLTTNVYRNYSRHRLKKPGVSCMITANPSKVGPNFHPFRRSGDGSECAFTFHSHLKHGSLNSLRLAGIFSCGSFKNSCRLGLSNHGAGAFPKRFFSQVPSVINKGETVGVQDGRNSGNMFFFRRLIKCKKWEKALAAQSKTKVTDSSISKDVEVKALTEQKVGSEKGAGKLGSLFSNSPIRNDTQVSKVKGKKRSKSKKTTEQISAANPPAEAAMSQSSKVTSQPKKSAGAKSGEKSVEVSELNLAAKTPLEIADGSSTKPQPKKKSGNSFRRGKLINSDTKSPQKLIPQKIGGVKPHGKMTLKQLYPATGKTVVVVESATKAKVIQGYLGDMFEVLPSYGHVRDLAARSGSVRPDDDFSMVWEVPSAAWTPLNSIKVALTGAETLILASDPDREGEAIAWHIIEMLQQQDALREDITVARVVFHEITEASIKSALQAPREIDENLVHAYLARRALDYLIGFNISPLLWRKLPGCQSAGRVQSAALALLCDREMEIDEFRPQEYWTAAIELKKKENVSSVNAPSFPAHLAQYDSKKLNQFSISSHTEAKEIEQQINSENFQVVNSKKNKMRKNPPTPYITSTLQQDAANKLHFSAAYTMKLAQKLYEGVQLSDGKAMGLITYTRTDGLHISDEACKDVRSLVIERYGQNFASESARKFFKKVKNSQEAHEAIRPTDVRRLPSLLRGVLDEDSLKLYTLIWCRTVACQMEPATIEQIHLDIGNAHNSIVLCTSSSRVEFPGYQAVFRDMEAQAVKYKEHEENSHDEAFVLLNSLKYGDPLDIGKVELKEHHTQPPPRYSEAALIKKLEELGIGRPSTYVSTLKVLQGRNYVTVKSRVLHPEFRGRMVSAFLSDHFSEVTDYSFTADMETELDNVSAGLTEWKGLLKDYWTRFSTYCERTSTVHIHQVEKMMEKKFGDFLFASLPDQSRTCPYCAEGSLIFKVSRFGAGYFIGCDQHPQCKYIAKTFYGDEEEEEEDGQKKNSSMEEPKLLGLSPLSNEKVLLKKGPYGCYVQLGEDRKIYLPRRANASHIKDVNSITLEYALELLRYPVTLGKHPADGQPVILKVSKVGFAVRHRSTIASVPKHKKPTEITLKGALKLLSGTNVRKLGRPTREQIEEAQAAL